MELLNRSQHHTTYRVVGKTKLRHIENWSNWQNHLGVWGATSLNVASQVAEPPAWSGAYDFDRASQNAPIQFFARDAMDAGNRAMVGFRKSDSPSCWMNIKAHNIDNAVDVTDIDSRTVQWTGLWTDTNYRVKHFNHKIKVDFVLTGENHPASFTETIKLGSGMSLQDNGNNTISVMKSGEEIFKMPAPYGYVETDENQESVIDVTMVVGAKINGLDSIVITPNADDLISVGYANNIVIDPSATISGTTDIEDNELVSGSGDNNKGTATRVGARSSFYRTIVRVKPSALPAGTYSQFDWNVNMEVGGVGGIVWLINRIEEANADWVEGTQSNGVQSGSSCWNDHTYQDIQEWAGSAGLGTSGTDYEVAGGITPTIAPGAQTFNLPTQWATDWSNGDWADTGFLIRNITDGGNNHRISSVEGSNPHTFDITYSEGGDDTNFFGCNF